VRAVARFGIFFFNLFTLRNHEGESVVWIIGVSLSEPKIGHIDVVVRFERENYQLETDVRINSISVLEVLLTHL
jgi:hypothetical protein